MIIHSKEKIVEMYVSTHLFFLKECPFEKAVPSLVVRWILTIHCQQLTTVRVGDTRFGIPHGPRAQGSTCEGAGKLVPRFVCVYTRCDTSHIRYMSSRKLESDIFDLLRFLLRRDLDQPVGESVT